MDIEIPMDFGEVEDYGNVIFNQPNHIIVNTNISMTVATLIKKFCITFENVAKALCKEEEQFLHIHMNTFGGDINACLVVYNSLKDLSKKGYTIYFHNDGMVANEALIIPLACDKRYISSTAVMYIAKIGMTITGEMIGIDEEDDAFVQSQDLLNETLMNIYNEILETNSFIKLKDIEIPSVMTASQCLKTGLFHEII